MARFVFVTLLAAIMATGALADPLDDARVAFTRGDFATTLVLLMPLADAGDRVAQHNLGAFFADGEGDYTTAAGWFRRAADQGLAEAQFNLGILYAKGRGVPQDYRQSAKWYRGAAEQGHPRAQLNLGVMYANGDGVPRNYVEAYKWFDLAVANLPSSQSDSRDTAVFDLELAAAKMTPIEIAEAEKLAKAWKPR